MCECTHVHMLTHLRARRVECHFVERKVKVSQSCPTLCDPMDCIHEILQARILVWVAFPFSRGSSQPRDQTQGSNPGLPPCRWILYQLSHKGSPKTTGVGSLSLLQEIFLTQESNWGLLHCRWILYQLGYEGSPCGKEEDTELSLVEFFILS